jgi:CheY-like chemotaxis protein
VSRRPHDAPALTARSEHAGSEGASLAAAIHETTNALTVILGWLERARQAADEHPEVADALERATRHARSARDSMRRTIGARPPAAPPERASTVLQRTCEDLAQEATLAGVRLGVRVADACADDYVAAPTVVWQVLTNLLLNAIALTPAGGAVDAAVEQAGAAVCFRVQDQGPGIAPERREQLLTAGESTREGGAGLGLRHAHWLASEHGGSLTLGDCERGACFLLRWPTCGRPTAVARAPARTPAGGDTLAGLEVLLLEDDPAVVELLELSLGARGAVVTAVGSAETLVAALEQDRYDVMLVDLSPLGSATGRDGRNDGLDRIVRQGRARQRSLTVVAISGSIAAQPHPDVIWVRKPFAPGELVEAIVRARAAGPGPTSG